MTKVVEFKTKKEQEKEISDQIRADYFNTMKESYFEANSITEEDIEKPEELMKRITQMQLDGLEIVCANEPSAISMSNFLLNRPEFENVSHFEFKHCISRLSMFIQLVPVLKTKVNYVFLDTKMEHSMNFCMMQRLADEVHKQYEDAQQEGKEQD